MSGTARFQWLVTVRASEGETERVQSLLQEDMLPLLRAQEECGEPRLAACIHCAGEHTYLATWPSEEAVVAFEGSAPYRSLMERLMPGLRTPPKRELWALLDG